MVRRFAREEIAPRADEIDKSNEFPADLWEKMGLLACTGLPFQSEGGAGMGYLAHCVAIEEISRASASVGLSYGAHSNLCVTKLPDGYAGSAPKISVKTDIWCAYRLAGDVRAFFWL